MATSTGKAGPTVSNVQPALVQPRREREGFTLVGHRLILGDDPPPQAATVESFSGKILLDSPAISALSAPAPGQ